MAEGADQFQTRTVPPSPSPAAGRTHTRTRGPTPGPALPGAERGACDVKSRGSVYRESTVAAGLARRTRRRAKGPLTRGAGTPGP